MSNQKSNQNLIWVDLEMTGLDPEKERIIEIARLLSGKDISKAAITNAKELLNQ